MTATEKTASKAESTFNSPYVHISNYPLTRRPGTTKPQGLSPCTTEWLFNSCKKKSYHLDQSSYESHLEVMGIVTFYSGTTYIIAVVI